MGQTERLYLRLLAALWLVVMARAALSVLA